MTRALFVALALHTGSALPTIAASTTLCGAAPSAIATPIALCSNAPSAIVAPIPPAAPALVEVHVPKNDGWVTDLAHLLTAQQEQQLEALMESYRQGTQHEIALLTLESLEGEPIERVGMEVYRAWGIGTKDKNDGALLVVAKNDRALRIEVGRGLEGTLTDSIAGRIIRDVITPQFKRGRFYEGIDAGIRAMHAAIGGDYKSLPVEAPTMEVGLLGLLPTLFTLFIFLMIISRIARAMRPGRRGRGLFNPVFFPGSFGGGGFSGRSSSGGGFRSSSGGGFGGFGGGGGASGGGASGRW